MKQSIQNQEEAKCWICGDIADSGEHMIKQSDLKQIFPETSQKHPIYTQKNGELQKQKIGGLKSDKFHFATKICKECNGNLSHNFDEAWRILSKYIHDNWKRISIDGKINLVKVFGLTYKKDMLFVQLYFGKIFTTKLLGSGVELSLSAFSEALLNSIEIENFYINFRYSNKPPNYVASSDVQVCTEKGKDKIIYIQHFCTIGEISIDMIYSKDIEGLNLYGALKPSQFTDTIKLAQLNYNQNYIKR